MGFDDFHLAEHLLTQPLQILIGCRPGAFGSQRDGYELLSRARSSRKNLFVAEGRATTISTTSRSASSRR